MYVTIRPKFENAAAYRGTFFDDLAVTAREKSTDVINEISSNPNPTRRDFDELMNQTFGAESDRATPDYAIPPTVYKTFWFSDRRYNPAHRNWALNELISKLIDISDFGPIGPKTIQTHSSFTIERERPEDKLVEVNARGVCMKDWVFEPLYCVGDFSILQTAIEALQSIEIFLRDSET